MISALVRHQRRVDPKPHAALDRVLGGDVGQGLEGRDEGRAAVRVARVVEGVGPKEQVLGPHRLGQPQRDRQKHRVSGRDVGHGDRPPTDDGVGIVVLGDRDGRRGQGRTADHPELEPDRPVVLDPHRRRYPSGRSELAFVPLAVVEGQGDGLKALGAGDGQHRRRVEAAREEDDRFGPRGIHALGLRRRGARGQAVHTHLYTPDLAL